MRASDMHIHSKYSWDSKMEIESAVKELIKYGIYYAGICDHVEFNYEKVDEVIEKFKIRNLEIDELNDKYYGKIKILKGAEISSPYLYPDKVERLKELDLDYLMGSIHKFDRNAKTGFQLNKATYDYYKSVLEMVKANQVDIIGHFDYINRYYKTDYSDSDFIEEIFEEINKTDLIIEVNTSAPRRTEGLYSSFPSINKMEMYASLKKEITLGTDAHKESELNKMLSENSYIVNRKGLEPVVFEKRKMLKI